MLTQSIGPNESMALFISVSKIMSATGTIGAHQMLSVRPRHISNVKKSYARRGIDDRCRRDEFHAVEEREQRKHRYIGAQPNYIFLFH